MRRLKKCTCGSFPIGMTVQVTTTIRQSLCSTCSKFVVEEISGREIPAAHVERALIVAKLRLWAPTLGTAMLEAADRLEREAS